MATAKRVLLGRVAGAHGIRGDVVVQTFTGEPANCAAYGPLSDAAGTRSFVLKVVRVTPKGVIARIGGVTDRNGAEALAGTELYVARDRLPAVRDGEFYHADLIGLAAVTPDGASLGRVVAVQNFGAGDLIEIELAGTRRTELVPFSDAFVPAIEIAAGRIVIALPPDPGDEAG